MKRLLSAILTAILITVPVSSETLRMAIYQLEPFLTEAENHGKPGGITITYWRDYIAPRMGVDLEILGPFPIKRIESMLLNGEVDVISHLTKIPSRDEVFYFPETHLTMIQLCMAVRPDSPIVSVTKPEDLFDKKISFIKSAYIPPMLIHDRISFDLVSSEDFRKIMLDMVIYGRADATLDLNYISFLYYLHENGYENKVRVFRLPVEDVKVYSIFRDTEQGRSLAKRFDEVNSKGLKDGVYEKLVEEYLKEHSITP